MVFIYDILLLSYHRNKLRLLSSCTNIASAIINHIILFIFLIQSGYITMPIINPKAKAVRMSICIILYNPNRLTPE